MHGCSRAKRRTILCTNNCLANISRAQFYVSQKHNSKCSLPRWSLFLSSSRSHWKRLNDAATHAKFAIKNFFYCASSSSTPSRHSSLFLSCFRLGILIAKRFCSPAWCEQWGGDEVALRGFRTKPGNRRRRGGRRSWPLSGLAGRKQGLNPTFYEYSLQLTLNTALGF